MGFWEHWVVGSAPKIRQSLKSNLLDFAKCQLQFANVKLNGHAAQIPDASLNVFVNGVGC